MVRLANVFSQIRKRKILVIGDLLLDTYTIGKARRISPEAPVAVINVQREERRAGGAGNVMLNLISMGSEVIAVGRVGDDIAGAHLRDSLRSEGIQVSGIFVQSSFLTPVKNRILADNQQIVRIDHETVLPIDSESEQKVLDLLPKLLEEVNAIAISDYGKGFLSNAILSKLIELALKANIPLIADPKGTDFTKYHGATVIKPNLGEAYAAANLPLDATLEAVASKIFASAQFEFLMITRSESGISIFTKSGVRHDFPVRKREIKDVTGAGDTVLAMLACAMANGLSLTTAAQLSNVAAGLAIEHFGCARITLSELARRLLEEDVKNKIFDHEHFFALQEALKGSRSVVFSINQAQEFDSKTFKNIHQLAQIKNRSLIVHISDPSPNEEFITLLASLHDVKFIVMQANGVEALLASINAEEIYTQV